MYAIYCIFKKIAFWQAFNQENYFLKNPKHSDFQIREPHVHK